MPGGLPPWVPGYLFYSHNLCSHRGYLDTFEGEEFVRAEVTVERYDELDVDTFIYESYFEIRVCLSFLQIKHFSI